MRAIKISKNQEVEKISPGKIVKFTDMGNVKEVMYLKARNSEGFGIKKLNKSEYLVIDTGEICEYKHIENRSQDKESLRRTFKKIRELINTNFTGADNELTFTITYKENIIDPTILYDDFKKFMKKLKYKYPGVEYINVVEPQGRGAWHCHVLLKFEQHKKIYIPNKEIAEIWGKGFVKVKGLKKDIDNLGAYLSAYLGDIEVTEDNINDLFNDGAIKPGQLLNIKEVEVDGQQKKIIKGGRLNYYPPGMNIYRASRGIKKPTVTHMLYRDAIKKVGAVTPTYTSSTHIESDQGKLLNVIIHEQYNIKKQKSK